MFMQPSVPPYGGRKATFSLPASDVLAIVRLAELTGRTFTSELTAVLRLYLNANGPAMPVKAELLDRLDDLERLDEPWEALNLSLPAWALGALESYAAAYGTSPERALAALVRGPVRTLVRTETRALERGESFAEAFISLLGEDAEALTE